MTYPSGLYEAIHRVTAVQTERLGTMVGHENSKSYWNTSRGTFVRGVLDMIEERLVSCLKNSKNKSKAKSASVIDMHHKHFCIGKQLERPNLAISGATYSIYL